MIVYGPVHSRRLGTSLGVSNLPSARCPYACSHCRSGRILDLDTERQHFYDPREVIAAVERTLEALGPRADMIDHITFYPQGEATLDVNLGKILRGLKPLGKKLAVFTNGAILWKPDVREDLFYADWVGLQADSTRLDTWLKINRPHPSLYLARILEGMLEFSKSYGGGLATETFLFKDVNDDALQSDELGRFIARLNPVAAYLSFPHRPPTEVWIEPPTETTLTRIYHSWSRLLEQVEILGPAPDTPGDELEPAGSAVLEAASRRPLTEGELHAILARSGGEARVLDELLKDDTLIRVEVGGTPFYLRKLWT